MPLYKRIPVNKNTKVLIWKIEESFDELSLDISLQPESNDRLLNMRSEIHRKGFLSIRHLLKETGYTDTDLFYDDYGKPHLQDGKHISITHSHTYTAIILSENGPVGIDIEKQRDKIVKIAHKFTPFEEYKTIANHDALVRKLTVVWGGKESLYKIYGKKKLLFLHHIYIEDFKFADTKTTGQVHYEGAVTCHSVHFLEFDGYTCVYAF